MKQRIQFQRTYAVAALAMMMDTAFAHPGHEEGGDLAQARPLPVRVPQSASAVLRAGGSVSITVEGDFRVIKSNGLPDHAPGAFPRPGHPNAVAPTGGFVRNIGAA